MPKEIVTAETNLNGKKTRKTPIPDGADRITAGALKLELRELVLLRKKLSESIDKELEEMQQVLKESKNWLTGNKM